MYSPKVREDLIPRLWHLARRRGVPMTALVAEAVEDYLIQYEGQDTDLETGGHPPRGHQDRETQ